VPLHSLIVFDHVNITSLANFEAFTAMLQVEVVWVVTPCSVVVGYQRSEVHAASIFTLKVEAAWNV
jgi:hypothetical protein